MNENYHSNSFTNGSTQPPKNRGGVIGAVLCGLIVLAGTVSLMGTATEIKFSTAPVSYVYFTDETPQSSKPHSTTHGALSPVPDDKMDVPEMKALQLEGQWVSSFDQIFRELPPGLYITETPENSEIQSGDILLCIDSCRVTNDTALANALDLHRSGDTITLTMYRDGKAYTIDIILTEGE